ncbi:hypothetical protein N7492_008852 [Penicillium capsulatum]|uniref:Arb2 domain-containing protein n=1 Tax=Penicillium capsulatum TaxID=69766 RepID=A0A9W9HW25_9EURO|nr:hypothetical protein N7492_008852 [Penicillium capsulatum]KAJ6106254.1 hypothetical protein N7512_009771 [Penicillium capsulatum]
MYAWKFSDMPGDPVFPADLTRLGYVLMKYGKIDVIMTLTLGYRYMITADDHIRQIVNPEESFKYKIDRNDRYNVKHREAMNECVRSIALERILDAGMEVKRLPLDTNSNDAAMKKPHIPILVSKNLEHKSHPRRILFLVPDPDQDLGVWSHRGVGRDGINEGTMANFVKGVLEDDKHRDTMLIIANPGQLLWHPDAGRAMTILSWDAMDRPHGPSLMAPINGDNRVAGHRNHSQHIQSIFETIVKLNLGPETQVGIMCMSAGGLSVLEYLRSHWSDWRQSIAGICFGDPLHTAEFDVGTSDQSEPTSLAYFLTTRCRAYVLSAKPVGSHDNDSGQYGCNCYSSSEPANTDCIMIAAWRDMLARLWIYFEERDYAEPSLSGVQERRCNSPEGSTEPVVESFPVDDSEESTLIC